MFQVYLFAKHEALCGEITKNLILKSCLIAQPRSLNAIVTLKS